jgi:ferredoxin-NADP reductase
MLLHADHSENAIARRCQIRDDIARLADASIYVWYEHGVESQLPVQGVCSGRMNLSQVRLPGNAVYHMCGPVPFMHAIRSALIELGIPPRDIHYEMFGPNLWQADYECGAEGRLKIPSKRSKTSHRHPPIGDDQTARTRRSQKEVLFQTLEIASRSIVRDQIPRVECFASVTRAGMDASSGLRARTALYHCR